MAVPNIAYDGYLAPDIYAAERELVFRGATWNYVCLKEEIPDKGDFKRSYVGDVEVVAVNTGEEVTVFENRCLHRGAKLVLQESGTLSNFICVYHNWCYSLEGKLIGIPFRRGKEGLGGIDKTFSMDRKLATLRTETIGSAVFATYAAEDAIEDLRTYIGTGAAEQIDTLFSREIEIIGYQRQFIRSNWKLYTDNVRDPNHGGLLHPFTVNMATYRLTMRGGTKLDPRGKNNVTYSIRNSDSETANSQYKAEQSTNLADKFELRDPSFLTRTNEHGDEISTSITSIFPGVVFQRIGNAFAVRHVRPKGVDSFELHWTCYAYRDDNPEMRAHRIRQANLAGPAGLVSLEDGEACEFIQECIRTTHEQSSVLPIGNSDEVASQDTMVTEIPIVGFWKYWSDLMKVSGLTDGIFRN